MRDHIFRKYDIRGVVGKDLNVDAVYDFGRALAFYFTKRNPTIRTIVVGMDGRTHSEAIKNELIRALLDSGLDVRFIGLCPTPVMYFALHTLSVVDAGVMITASHNGKECNGFKICLGTEMIWAHEIIELRNLFKRKVCLSPGRTGLLSKSSVIPVYLDWLEAAFAHLKGIDIAAVLDCCNGAAGTVIPELVRRMEWSNVILLHEKVDGHFPGGAPDPTSSESVCKRARLIAESGAQVGIGFDGDADRMVLMTHDGMLVAGDMALTLFSEALLRERPGAGVVFDSKCSQVLQEMLTKWGARSYMTPTGHAFVKKKMVDAGALLAGELSCHFVFADRYFGYDDGAYAMLRIFEILHDTGKTLRTLLDRFPTTFNTGEVRIDCPEECQQEVVQAVHKAFVGRNDATIQTLDGVRVTTPYGWGIVRASNTQPVISFSCESITKEGFERIKQDFQKALASSFDSKILQGNVKVEMLEQR